VNYRTSHQIRARADRLLPGVVADGDGLEEDRRGIVSVFGGPAPETLEAGDAGEEIARVAAWLAARLAEGIDPDEIGVFARTEDAARRGEKACAAAGLAFRRAPPDPDTPSEMATVCTMALANGLEFRAVAVMACDEEISAWRTPGAGRHRAGATRDLRNRAPPALRLLHAGARAPARSGVTPVSEYLAEFARPD
jgi:hypothetical protein